MRPPPGRRRKGSFTSPTFHSIAHNARTMTGIHDRIVPGAAGARLTARCLTLALPLSLLAAAPLAGQSASPPESPPAEWGPISIDLHEIEYPFPVQYLERELFGENVRIAYMDVAPTGTPNGRTAYLTHGASYYGWYWEETIRALTNEGYRVIAEDRLGWGKSSKALIPYSWHLHAENMKAVLDHLGVEQAAMIGHSMGGQMVTRFTRLYPEVATHMILVNPIGLTGPGDRRHRRRSPGRNSPVSARTRLLIGRPCTPGISGRRRVASSTGSPVTSSTSGFVSVTISVTERPNSPRFDPPIRLATAWSVTGRSSPRSRS